MPSNNESTMKWKVDIAQLKAGMQDAKRAISLANAEFKNATAGIGKWQASITGVEAKIKQLSKTSESQKTVLANLEKQYAIVAKEMGEDSAEAQRLKIQIENQQAAIKKTDSQLASYSSQLGKLQAEQKAAQSPMAQLNSTIDEQSSQLADLKKQYANSIVGNNPEEAARLSQEIDELSTELAENKKKMAAAEKAADELDKSLDGVGDSADDAANGGLTTMKVALGNLAAMGVAKLVDGLRQLGSAIVDVGKQSIASYASYEQLVGGVDKLYGDASKQLQRYAADAYRTAGMSANQYMEQATSFSAALIGSLGGDTAKAAELTDVAMRAMSDNVNTFGSNMQDVQNAVQGFSKQNYTMLDNLKLGYGGTKEEMQRLIKDANDYAAANGKAADLSIESFADIIQAIQLVQEKQNIAGTTAKEAASTIEGSMGMAKAAWENLLTALADDEADVAAAFNTFVDSAVTYLGNLLPRVGVLMEQVAALIGEKLREAFPEFMAVVDAIIGAIKTLIDFVIENKEVILAAIAAISAAFVVANFSAIINKITKAIKGWTLVTKAQTAAQKLLNLAQNASPMRLVISLIVGLVAAFMTLWKTSDKFRNFWLGLWDKIKKAAAPVIDGIKKAFSTAWNAIKKVWNAAGKFFSGIWSNIKAVFSVVGTWFKGVFSTAWNNIKAIWSAVSGFFASVWNAIKAIFAPVVDFFKTLFGNAWTMIKNIWILASVFFTSVWNAIKAIFAPVVEWFRNVFQTAWNNIKAIWNAVSGFFAGIWNGIKAVFSVVGTWFKEKFSAAWNGIKSVWSAVSGFFSGIWTGIKNIFGNVGSWFKEKFSNAWESIKSVFSNVGGFFGGIWDTIKEKFTNIGQKVGDAIGGVFKAAINGVLATAENVLNAPIRAINGLIGKINSIPGINLGTLGEFNLPRLARGAVLNSARAVIAGEDGAEAIVPLERNKQWIAAVAKDMVSQLNMDSVKLSAAASGARISGGSTFGSGIGGNQTIIFNQTNTSPKALSRLDVYRDTKSLLFSAKVGLANV